MTITEGGSNSEVWNQIKADMLGCKSATLENAQGAVLTDAVIAKICGRRSGRSKSGI